MSKLFPALACVAALLAAAPAAFAADGDPNGNFNTTGLVTDNLGGSTAEIIGSAVQPDGDLVVVGQVDSEGFVARYLPTGALDSSFGGGDGVTIIDSGATDGGERLRAVAIQSDGKIVAVKDTSVSAGDSWVLARLGSDGTPDATFDGPGTPGNGVFRISAGASADLTASATDLHGPVTFACKMDSAAPAPCTSPAIIGPLADGAHTITVIATDGVGNTDPSPPAASFTVTTPPPPPPPPPTASGPTPVITPPSKKCKKKKKHRAASAKKCKKRK